MRITRAGIALLGLCVIGVIALYHDARPTRGQPLGAVHVGPPSATELVQTQTLVAGLWRVDGNFESTIRIKNSLVVGPVTVTPVLYMADGTPYSLPPVTVPTAGVVVVDVNQALAQAASSLGPHLSQFGSAALTWQYTSPGHVVASVQMLDAPDSLVFTVPFSLVEDGTAGPQTARGLWWRNDSGIGGYVSLANTTGGAIGVSVQAVGSHGSPSTVQSFQVPGHGVEMLDLDSLTAGIPPGENQAGGIVVQYQGDSGAILVSGGLVNQSEGYSANMPFCSHDMASAAVDQYTFVSVGVMVGKPDVMMGFPQNTTFQPYAVARNTTTSPLILTAQINYMGSAGPVTVAAPPQQLAPLETRQIGLSAILTSQGLRNFNGMLNLTFSFNGHPSDAQVATGSVDQTGTYVFEVEPEGLGPGPSKIGGYWNVANGYDTMLNYWNPSSSAEDVVATIYYGDGSGQYQIPLHLAPFASGMIDMMMLIESGQPDLNGNVIPMTVQSGSVVFSNAKGKTVPMTLNVAVGAFDVTTATCCSQFVNCCGDSNFIVDPAGAFCPVGQSMQCTAQATNCDGTIVYPSYSSWSSSNTAIATISGSGMMTGVAPGQVTITVNFSSAPLETGTFCVPHTCISHATSGSSNENCTPTVSVSCSPTDLAMGPTAPASTNKGTCNTTVKPSGGSFTWQNPATVKLTPNGASATYTAAARSASIGDTIISVTYSVNSEVAQASSHAITVHQPTSLAVDSDNSNLTHSCTVLALAHPGDGTCNTSSSSVNYNAVMRQRQYSVLDQFSPPNKFQSVGLSAVSATEQVPFTSTCPLTLNAGSSSVTPFTDSFYLCTSCCLPQGPGCTAKTNPVQTIYVNGLSVRTETINWSCSGATLSP